MDQNTQSYSLKDYFGTDTNAYNNYKAGQKSGQYADLPSYIAKTGAKSIGGVNSGNLQSTIQGAVGMAQNAVQPAVGALQAQATPLKQRYNDLIASLKGQQQTETNRQTVTTNNELARRGITSNSGVGQQELTNALNPITSQYSGQIKDVGNQENQDLSSLATQIAQLQSNAGLQGLTLGNSQYQFGQNQGLQQQQLANQLAQQKATNDYQNKVYNTVTLPQSQANIANVKSEIANRNTGTSDTDWKDFIKGLINNNNNSNNNGSQGTVDPNKKPLVKNYLGTQGWSVVQ